KLPYIVPHRSLTMFQQSTSFEVDRHKAAIVRGDLSRPVRLALEAGLFAPGSTFFDYGCGHGGDVERVLRVGFTGHCWDPHFCPSVSQIPSDVVNLGYILNVIENLVERQDALRQAWSLTKRCLIVSAQVLLDYLSDNVVAYGDGVITNRNTFQKYFEQEEL